MFLYVEQRRESCFFMFTLDCGDSKTCRSFSAGCDPLPGLGELRPVKTQGARRTSVNRKRCLDSGSVDAFAAFQFSLMAASGPRSLSGPKHLVNMITNIVHTFMFPSG